MDKWICPQCETANENEECVVCGMSRTAAQEIYTAQEKRKELEKQRNIILRFPDDKPEIETDEPSKINVYSVITLIIAIIGLFVSIFAPIGAIIISSAAIVMSIAALARNEQKNTGMLAAGIILGVLSIICALLIMAY